MLPAAEPLPQARTIPQPAQVLYISLELSPSKWLVTSLLSGTDRMSKHLVTGGDGSALLRLLAALRTKAEQRAGAPVVTVAIREAGLDGFSVHRLLEADGVESWVVDPASVAVPRRMRRARSDAIDGETLLRTLLAFRRGEPRVCSMVHPPSVAEEDRRRITRERRTLLRGRIEHTSRIKGLLMTQGVTGYDPLGTGYDPLGTGYDPLGTDRRTRLESLETRDGHALPPRLKAEIGRGIERRWRDRSGRSRPSATRSPPRCPRWRPARRPSCCGSRGSARRPPRCSGSRACSGPSPTGGSSPPTPGWRRRLG
jgi:transposase